MSELSVTKRNESTPNQNTRVLLGLARGLTSELVAHELTRQAGVEVIGQIVNEPIELLVAVSRWRPDVLIHAWPEGEELQSLLSQLYDVDPTISVIRINLAERAGYLQVPLRSLDSFLNVVRQGRSLFPLC